MAFKSLDQYTEEKNKNFFILQNDGEFADVVFMYRGIADVQIVDAHYIKSSEYSGYVHCCGEGCPACAKGIRVQNKIFIPLYVISKNGVPLETPEIRYFDRTTYFEPQLRADVLNNYPNPSECVFRITRHGKARSQDTTYSIEVLGLNSENYDSILAKVGTSMPDDYEKVVKLLSASKLSEMLMNTGSAAPTAANLGEYVATPRVAVPTSNIQPIDSAMPPVTTVIDAPVTTSVEESESVSNADVESLDDDDISF